MKETSAHKKIRLRNCPQPAAEPPVILSPVKKRQHKSLKTKSPPSSNHNKDKSATSQSGDTQSGVNATASNHLKHSGESELYRVLSCQLTDMPQFLSHMIPKAVCPSLHSYCSDRSAQYDHQRFLLCSSLEARDLLRYGAEPYDPHSLYTNKTPGGLQAILPPFGFSNIYIPDKQSLIVDAGKMHVLDELLTKLKKEGHRVLIYSTMTKVIDLLEEFMWYRKHQYIRLDGSSKISDRRDMVSDFQSKTDIFVFLLSTRAGGLGINLTAADTVIFYDSDWNPTVDAQAMDRAHRLGQTKQVTVYRLICKGTIEERILERAREKSEIQRMVISGHNDFKPDVLKAKEVVSLLIDDDALKQKIEQAQGSKQERAEKRKLAAAAKKAEGPKAKRGKKSEAPPGGRSGNSSSCATPVPVLTNGSVEGEADVEVDVMTGDDNRSITSSPAASSAPSTPSMRCGTPSNTSTNTSNSKSRTKAKSKNKSSVKAKTSLKKALSAAEIAGTNAAYAAAGITPTAKGLNSRVAGR
ncbi:hypothetical protein EB796_005757 [Bugula neritina]|uniref:Chromatin-remodeling ATPase INO80 n=1 Tax=Bugula neritina TaxID=10212 RepID=A0A7J7KCJ7_BUGNE|nr:hypothetical protein EB796_005757 [Bugula neritina]